MYSPFTSYMKIGISGLQNSLMNWRHMPQGEAGGEMSVATARARKVVSPSDWYERVELVV